MKKRIRLTESDLHQIVKESVRKVLNESITLQDDIRNYFELDKEYDGSANMANARINLLNSCCGDLPWEVDEKKFVNMIYSLPSSWSVESLTNAALQWVERQKRKNTAPKIY
jgi:hypothetical protein